MYEPLKRVRWLRVVDLLAANHSWCHANRALCFKWVVRKVPSPRSPVIACLIKEGYHPSLIFNPTSLNSLLLFVLSSPTHNEQQPFYKVFLNTDFNTFAPWLLPSESRNPTHQRRSPPGPPLSFLALLYLKYIA